MPFDAEQYKRVEREVYSKTAASYEKYGAKTFQAYAQPLLDGAGLKPGQHVLDVACGPGILSLMVAPLVGNDGSVMGIDLAPGMVELAKKKAHEAGLTSVTFREADAEDLPFQDDSFDVVLCNHGLVHTTDRAKAMREMWRVIKRGGIVAISTWSTPDRSLTLSIVAKAIAKHFPAAMVPGAPMWFDFGPQGVLEKTLSDAGFDEIRVTRHTIFQQMQNGEEYWQAVVGISGRLQMLLQSIPLEVASNIKHDVIRAAEDLRAGEGIKIPSEELIAWAIK
jgi:ubiquinone/menaquinone biosynthesis C-methylase UbiE